MRGLVDRGHSILLIVVKISVLPVNLLLLQMLIWKGHTSWGNYKHPDIWWKDNTAVNKQFRRFLECIGDNFLA